MTTRELVECLKKIMDVHPEAAEAQVWSYCDEAGFKFQITEVGWDKRHRPNRVKLEG